MNKAIKILGGVFATILLGAIGSGLWERMLSPFIDFSSNKIVDLFSLVSTKYQASIYTYAAQIDSAGLSSAYHYVVVMFFFLCLLFVSMRKKAEHMDIAINKILFGLTAAIFYSSCILILFIGFSTDKQSYEIRSYSERSMDILRPYIQENNYLLLKSEFLRIESREDFSKFDKQLRDFSKEHNVKLPIYKAP